jgi:hypothetical protein
VYTSLFNEVSVGGGGSGRRVGEGAGKGKIFSSLSKEWHFYRTISERLLILY